MYTLILPPTVRLSVDLPDEFRNERVTVEIYSLDGKKIWQNEYSGNQTMTIDFALQKGIYFLQAKSQLENLFAKTSGAIRKTV